MKVLISDINHNGIGIGRIDNKVIFIPYTMIGDIVEVSEYNDKSNYLEAIKYKIVEYSKSRRTIECPYYMECGGCNLMHIPYNEQLNYKINKVTNILKKYSNIDIKPSIESSFEYKYRNKIELHIKNNKLGMYKYNSNDLVETDRCLLISDKMNKIISIIKNNIQLSNIESIIIKESNNNEVMLIFKTINNKSIDINKEIFNNMVTSIYINDTLIYGNDIININLGKYKYRVSSNSFFQVNNYMANIMYSYIRDIIPSNKRVLDLYCGTGSIGIYLSSKCECVMGIEINESAIKNANENKLVNNISNIDFKRENANKINYKKGDFDIIVIDPPRSGLDKKTTNLIKNMESNIIVYVSCNPITLVRDINNLSDMYKLESIKLFDMFPNTYHLESVCYLEKKLNE